MGKKHAVKNYLILVKIQQALWEQPMHCEALGCGKSSSILATEVKEINLFGVELSSFIPIEKE